MKKFWTMLIIAIGEVILLIGTSFILDVLFNQLYSDNLYVKWLVIIFYAVAGMLVYNKVTNKNT